MFSRTTLMRLAALALLLPCGFHAAAQTSLNFTLHDHSSTSEDIRYSCDQFTLTVTTGATPSATLNASCNSAPYVSAATSFNLEPAVSVSATDSTLTWNGTGGTGFVATCSDHKIQKDSTEEQLELAANCDPNDTTATTTLRLDTRLKNSSGSLAVK